MYHDLPRDASFWLFLFTVDQNLADRAREKGCPCGGRLHSANYRRNLRGVDNLPEEYGRRLSFYCDRDGCRKRVTPPSVRCGLDSSATDCPTLAWSSCVTFTSIVDN